MDINVASKKFSDVCQKSFYIIRKLIDLDLEQNTDISVKQKRIIDSRSLVLMHKSAEFGTGPNTMSFFPGILKLHFFLVIIIVTIFSCDLLRRSKTPQVFFTCFTWKSFLQAGLYCANNPPVNYWRRSSTESALS